MTALFSELPERARGHLIPKVSRLIPSHVIGFSFHCIMTCVFIDYSHIFTFSMWILFYDEIVFALAIQTVHFAGQQSTLKLKLKLKGRTSMHESPGV